VHFSIHCVVCDRLLEYVLSLSKAKVVFVATDKTPMTSDIKEHFKKKKVAVLCCCILMPVLQRTEAISSILLCFHISVWKYLYQSWCNLVGLMFISVCIFTSVK